MSINRHQTHPSSPNRVYSQNEDVLYSVELSPIVPSSIGQLSADQQDDTMAASANVHLVRADTEQCPRGDLNAAEQQTPQGPEVLTSVWPAGRRPYNYPISEEMQRWRAHHQDFYTSKWFRSLEISIIVSVIVVAIVVFLFTLPFFTIDLFASPAKPFSTIVSTMTFLSPVFLLLCLVVGGIFKSKVFR